MSMLARCYYTLCRTRPGQHAARGVLRALRRYGLCDRFRMPLDALMLEHAPAAGLMRLWSRMHWSSGDGMMPPEQLLAVYRMAATAPVPGDIVELGSWIGLTTCYLATACVVTGEGRVHAVDTFEGTREDGGRYPSISKFGDTTLPEFKRRIRRAGLAEHIDILKGLTTDAVHAYRGRRIRMLLIDADHAYDGVRTDFEDWSPLVAPGGLIVFHDYLMPDVARFVDNVVAARTDIAMTPGLVDPNVMAVTKRASVAPVSASASRTHAISPATSTQGGVPVSAPQHGIVSTCRAQSHPIVADREPLPRAEATNP